MPASGSLAFAATAADDRYKATVSISPLIDPSTVTVSPEIFDEFAVMLSGVGREELKAQWNSLPAIQTMSDGLSAQAVLLITADDDDLFPPSHYKALAAAVESIVWKRFPGADHVFSAARKQLVDTTISWLQFTFDR